MKITENVFYVGVDDKTIDLFEGQYRVPNGMAYNSYVIVGEKIAVLDTVSEGFGDEWLSAIEKTLGGKAPDYLIVQHMEPDHSANVTLFCEKYKNAAVVSNQKAFTMMKNFFGNDFAERHIVVKDGEKLSLGGTELAFVFAPMVHWPEVMVTYDETHKILFSADAFGKFGASDACEDWACEARRYYFGIVGKYGVMVQTLLKKAAALDVKTICPLHGPVLKENLGYYLNLYDIWSSYKAEADGVFIAYTSVYGHTEKAAKLLAEKLSENSCKKVVMSDLARSDMAENVEDAFKYGKLVLATTTYNGDVFPFMREFIAHLTERNYQNRKIGFIENGSWAPIAAKIMKEKFASSKNVTFAENTVTITSALNETSISQINALAKELAE